MTLSQVIFSSKTDDWATPQKFFEDINKDFGPFTLDVCASSENAKCPVYYDKDADGLKQRWTGRVWMNPPYGRGIGKWMEKAYQSVLLGDAELVVCLVPARTDTKWWWAYCEAELSEYFFIKGRLKFGDATTSAPFPSAVIVMRRKTDDKLPQE